MGLAVLGRGDLTDDAWAVLDPLDGLGPHLPAPVPVHHRRADHHDVEFLPGIRRHPSESAQLLPTRGPSEVLWVMTVTGCSRCAARSRHARWGSCPALSEAL